jgi:Domain of unknown function (DUF1996)/Domain of unknown function (DUF4124)
VPLINNNNIYKSLLLIALCFVGFISLICSNAAHSEIYKWRDNRGVIQYSDKPPASGFNKADRHEIVNALQVKDLCAEPTSKTAEAASKKINANFFGITSSGLSGMASAGSPRPTGIGSIGGIGGLNGFGRNANLSPARPAATPIRVNPIANNTPRGIPGLFGLPARNTAANPTNRPPSFTGLNPTSFFNNGNNPVTVFGRPTNVAAAKPPVVAAPVKPPVANPPSPAPSPTPAPAPAPAPAPSPSSGNPNIVQSGLMPAVDISKNMTPAIGASEPFIGKYEPPAPGDGDGQFRTVCRPSHMGNDDPIIYPNQQGAAHHHTFFGNTSLNYKSDVSNIRNVGNSTCKGGTANLSAYWVPSMIDSATKTPLVPNDAVFYYKTGYTVKRELVTPPPKGLRIIAGNGKSTVSQRIDKYTNQVRYNCVLPGNKAQPESDSIPACPQGSEIHSVINFPNCWDGKNLDSPDHQSHMAYAKYGVGCPATHPTAIPTITFNIFYKVTQAAGTANWRLASDNYAKNGYNAGYSGHADWVNGWDTNIMKMAVENCDNKGVDCGVGNLGNGTGLWFKKDSEY